VAAFLTFAGRRPAPSRSPGWPSGRTRVAGATDGRWWKPSSATCADGARFLLVKTLSPREPDPNYAQTRAFYLAMGFEPLTDLDLWGPENPALLMIRTLA
jgi:hypothetical protein